MARRRFTININVDEIGDIEKLIRTLRAWRPDVVVLMNGFMNDKYRYIRSVIREWNAIVIYRHYEASDGHLWRSRTVDEHIRLLEGFATQDADVWWYVSNEPLPGDSERALMQKWHADLIDKAVTKGLRLCVGNLAVAAMGDKKDIDGGRWDVFLTAVGKHADRKINGYCQIVLGVHTYAHAVLPMHCAGRDPRDLIDPKKVSKDKWPSALEVYSTPEDNWLIFREDWLVVRIKVLTGKMVQVAVTEGVGWDRMPNIVKDFPSVTKTLDEMAGREVRGLPTVMELFKKLFPNWTPEQAACEQMAWVENIYPDNYVCFALFTWSQNPHWRLDYDISALDKFLALWPTYPTTTTPPPSQPSTDLPADGWYDCTVFASPDPATIYASKDGSAIIGKIHTSAGLPARTVFMSGLRQPIDCAIGRGWLDMSNAWVDPKYPPIAITADDSRWKVYKFAPIGGKTANVYEKPMVSKIVGYLQVGELLLEYIPNVALTAVERSLLTPVGGVVWLPVKAAFGVGFVRAKDVEVRGEVEPPVPPIEYVRIPTAEYATLKHAAEELALEKEATKKLSERIKAIRKAYIEKEARKDELRTLLTEMEAIGD